MKTALVILTLEQAASLRRSLVSPVHNEWLLRRMKAPIDLKQFGLSDEQVDAIQKTIEETP